MLVVLGFKGFLRTPCGIERRHKTIANMMTDPTTFLVRQIEHRQSVLIVDTIEWTLVMTVFFSDAGCIGLQGFLEDPMWSRASPQDRNSSCHCQYDDISEYFSVKADRASSILIVETLEWTIMPLIQPLAFDSFFSMLCIVLTLSPYLQYVQ